MCNIASYTVVRKKLQKDDVLYQDIVLSDASNEINQLKIEQYSDDSYGIIYEAVPLTKQLFNMFGNLNSEKELTDIMDNFYFCSILCKHLQHGVIKQ